MGRKGHAGTVDTLNRLLRFLAAKSLPVVIDDQTAALVTDDSATQYKLSELSKHCDLLIVVGGDGTMLNTVKHVVADEIPVIGVNRGRLGFLTDILPDELDTALERVLAGEFDLEKRFLLDVFGPGPDSEAFLGSALNDIVIHPGPAAQMIEFELFIDDKFVYSLESDGLIVATPTGSTAYALSAGGPIMHPGLHAMVLVPMYPHSLSSRPIAVGGDSEIRLVVAEHTRRNPLISCDGEVKYTASAGDSFLIRKKPIPLNLIHPSGHSFYQSCRSKLGWGNRLIGEND